MGAEGENGVAEGAAGDVGMMTNHVKPGVVGRPNLEWQPLSLFTAAKPTALLTKIHGKWYDLTEFERHHPGGPVALGLARGRDASVMFESHHPFTNRKILDAILAKYEIDASDSKHLETLEQRHGVAEHSFLWPSGFGEALKFQVKEYFQGEATRRNVSIREATKATPARWIEIAVLAVLYIATFPGFFRGDWRFLILFPLSAWLLGVNTFHDATHFALSTKWRVNALVPYLYPYFSSPFVWYHQHNIGHHSYPNLSERDPDVLHHYWMKREHKDVKWLPEHKKQSTLWYMLFWWAVAVEFGMTTMEDIWMLQSNLYNEVVPMMAISGPRRMVHVIGRTLTIVVIHAWPFLVLDTWTKCFVFAIFPYLFFSCLFMMNTQINHLLPHTTHAADSDWYKHQVVTAQDFGVGSKFCHLFSGGLNYQVIHHLFPTVNHCHLPQLQPIVARLCEKYDVSYSTAKGYIHAISLHHQHSKSMSTKVEYVE
ncbi:hypothetical protein KC19_8G164100 [Ceratodon purpureus]|uniref:Cytochrome b5 heme-binding domain-containing protein n=1 Tax=Ceratodon purpureus TaxID=3225 RepID=A0A8T0H4M2_CERPU|nr:hypothetical protein KC19_8G164100 [Ceratodon purpureus]